MIVLDTSAALTALIGRPRIPDLLSRLATEELHAPHLIDVEVLHALRGLVLGRELTRARATDALSDFLDLSIVRYPHPPLAGRIWDLRSAMTAYDAAFVALSEALGVPLVTCDARLGRTKTHSAHIEVFGKRSRPRA